MSSDSHYDPEVTNKWYWDGPDSPHEKAHRPGDIAGVNEQIKQANEDAEAISIARRLIAEKQKEMFNDLVSKNEYQTIDSINDYQNRITQFAIYPAEHAITYLALGLASEAGEVAGKVKKVIRDSSNVFDDDAKLAILAEIGDVLWYASMLATEIGIDMSDILAENYYKLEFRARRGMLKGSGDNR